MTASFRTRCVLVAASGLLLTAACKDKKRSEIVLGIATDLDAPSPLETVRLEVFKLDGGEQLPTISLPWRLSGARNQPFELPGSFTLFDDGNDRGRMRIRLAGEDARGAVLLERTAIVSFVDEQTLFMRMSLTASCVRDEDCPAQLTCVEGRCRSPEVDPKTLPTYSASLVTSTACGSGTVFTNTSSKEPLPALSDGCKADEFCLEGVCYKRPEGPQPIDADLDGTVFDDAGQPVIGARIEGHQGAVDGPVVAPAVASGAAGVFHLPTTSAPDTRTLYVVASAAGYAPQTVAVPIPTGVSRLVVPVVLPKLRETVVSAGAPAAFAISPQVTLQAPRNLPAEATTVRVRYAVLDPMNAPGRLLPAGAATALQAAGLVYVDVVSGTSILPTATVPVRVQPDMPLPPVTGAGAYRTFRANTQASFTDTAAVAVSEQGISFDATAPGVWGAARPVPTACVRGKAERAGSACKGVRVSLSGGGLSSFDSAAADGTFCVVSAPAVIGTLNAGTLKRTVTAPSEAGSCAAPAACLDVGPLLLSDADCAQAQIPTSKADVLP